MDHFLRPYGRGGRWTQRTTTLEKLYPKLADSATLAPHATTAWSWGAYVQLVASADADFHPNALYVTWRVTHNTAAAAKATHLEIELATGASGSETPIHIIPDAVVSTVSLAGAAPATVYSATYPVGPELIASGARIAARLRHSEAGDVDVNIRADIYLAGHEAPVPASDPTYPLDEHLAGAATPRAKHTPAGSTLAVGTAAYPNYGSWVQALASAPADLLVHGIAAAQMGSSLGKHLQFGIGAAAAETPYALLGVPAFSGLIAGLLRLRRPLLVLSGERLAVRMAGGAGNCALRVLYEEL